MTFRVVWIIVITMMCTSCFQRRDFGCLMDGYSVVATSAIELFIAEPSNNAVLGTYVPYIGIVPGYIVAACNRDTAPVGKMPEPLMSCVGYNTIDTKSGQVLKGLSEVKAETVLASLGRPMPKLTHISEYFTREWPDGDIALYCRAHPYGSNEN